MIDYKEKLKIEKDFISLLLQNKELVADWLGSQLSMKYFDEAHHYIIRAITAAFNEGVLLTRKTFISFIKKNVKAKLEIQSQEHIYNISNMLHVNINDYPDLKNKIFEASVDRSTLKCIEDYQKDNEVNGGLVAAKKLAFKLNDIVVDSSSENKIYYESVSDYAPVFYDKLMENRNKEGGDDTILCHIKEIDETLGTGFAPGSLILFCGDVGGYKCLNFNSLQYLKDGTRITLKELYERKKLGKKDQLMQFKHFDHKISFANVLDVIDTGKKGCYKITTQLGHEITSTKDHRHLSWGGYKETSELSNGDFMAVSRKAPFGNDTVDKEEALALGGLISEGGTNTSCTFTNFDASIIRVMRSACRQIAGGMYLRHKKGIRIKGQYGIRGIKPIIRKYDIKCKAIDKKIHKSIFSWDKISISYLLKMMYSGDGGFSISHNKNNNKYKYLVSYYTSSKQLADDVRDLLLKFGIIASVKNYKSYYKKNGVKINKGLTYRVNISDNQQIYAFYKEIGFIGNKQKLFDQHVENIVIKSLKSNPNRDIIPAKIWETIDKKFKEYNKSRTGCRRFYRRDVYDNWKKDLGHCGNINRSMSRSTLKRVAQYLDNDKELLSIADSDIYWDKIIDIEYVGEEQTYEVCMAGSHNFVSNNIVTHNSTMMLNVAINVWKMSHKNVLYVPLEMPREKMYQKFISRETKIPFEQLQHPKLLSDKQVEDIYGFEAKINMINEEHNCNLYIMEAPEQIPVSAIRREIERNIDIFKPNLVVIDYIANLIPDETTHRRDRNDLEVGDMLKYLRTMGKPGAIHEEGLSVVSGAQLGREGLKRYRKSGSKGVFYSEDIHGSHQYSADSDAMYAQMKPQQANDNTRIEFIQIKSRYGKNVFSNGSNKTMLEVDPKISLIKSINTNFYTENQSEIMDKVNDDTILNFDEHIKADEKVNPFEDLLP